MIFKWRFRHYRRFMFVIMTPLIVTVYPSATWKLICSTYNNYPVLFRVPRTWLSISNSVVLLEKRRTLTLSVHLVYVPIFFSGGWVAHLLFLYVLFWLMYVYCFVCPFSVFVPVLHSFEFLQNLGSIFFLFYFLFILLPAALVCDIKHWNISVITNYYINHNSGKR